MLYQLVEVYNYVVASLRGALAGTSVDRAVAGLGRAVVKLAEAEKFHLGETARHAEVEVKAAAQAALHSAAYQRAQTVGAKIKDLIGA